MPSKRKKKQEEEAGGAPAWMVTYGDMMSLLLTFFVLLLSFSTISEKKLNQAILSLQGAFNVLPKNASVVFQNAKPTRKQEPSVKRAARELQRQLQVMGRDKDVKVEYDQDGGLKIVLPNKILFGSASAILQPEAAPVMESVAELLSSLPTCFIEVRGHTDSRPLTSSGRFRDNYDLSYARADTVARRVSGSGAIPLDSFEIIACGPGQPLATNDTDEGQQANRRVEIYVRGAFEDSKLDELKARVDKLTRSQSP